jgi:hypothetical protein
MAFPPPVEYDGGSGEEGREGGAFGYVEEEMVRKVKSYGVISRLNCLGKVIKKVVATMLADHCEWNGTFHLRQYGSRRNLSMVDAVGVLMSEHQHPPPLLKINERTNKQL